MEIPEITEILEDWLKKNGFDGLINDDEKCTCLLDDLCPCREPKIDCYAGTIEDCDDPKNCDFEDCEGEHMV